MVIFCSKRGDVNPLYDFLLRFCHFCSAVQPLTVTEHANLIIRWKGLVTTAESFVWKEIKKGQNSHADCCTWPKAAVRFIFPRKWNNNDETDQMKCNFSQSKLRLDLHHPEYFCCSTLCCKIKKNKTPFRVS